MKKITMLSWFLLFAFFTQFSSSYAILPEFAKEDLIKQSEAIVYGKVLEFYSTWAEDNSQIYTYVSFEVIEQFKGEKLERQVTIQIPGGKVEDITQVTTDTPALLPGMKAVLHLFVQDTGYFWIYGWEKGALEVKNDTILSYDMTLSQFRALVNQTLNGR
jgi:hypothetical protein